METEKCSHEGQFKQSGILRFKMFRALSIRLSANLFASKKRLASIPASVVLALSLMVMAPGSASAGSIFVNGCFGDFSSQLEFDVADTICIDGNLSTFQFLQFFGDAYIIPNQTWSGGESLVDIRSENRVVSGITGGGFFGVPIGLPGGTPRGEYDVILDDGANGVYNAGYDSIQGAGSAPGIIVVESGRPIPDVSAIKGHAAAMETQTEAALAGWHAMLDLLSAYSLASAVAGGPIGILEYALWKPYNDLTGDFAHKIMGGYGPNPNPPPPRQAFGVMGNAAKRWGDLARDPPDPVFDVLVPLDIASEGAAVQDYVGTYSYPFQPVGTTQREANLVAWGNLGVQQAGLVHALRQTFEKYQGADQADDDPYTWLQARQLKKYSEMLQANLTDSIATVTQVRADIIAAGDNRLQDVSAMAALQQRVIASGLTTEEQDTILGMGFTPADITEIELRIEGWVLPATDGRISDSLDALVVEMTNTRTQLATLASESQALMDYLAPDFTLEHPTANAGGPYNGIEGTPVTLDGTGSSDPQADISTYEWDLDEDGVFDDALGTGPTHLWGSEFIGSIGLKVTDAFGNWDIAYADVVIGSANSAPQIIEFQPVSTAPTATSAAPLNFSATATDADSDSLTYEWALDGVSVASGQTYSYTPAVTDSGTVLVQVLVSDGSPFSVDVTESRRVTVFSDSDGDSFYSDVDCNDGNAAVNPAAFDACNGIDDNCDGTIDEGSDTDGDGVTTCAGDCDDGDPNNFPGNAEVCDGQDNNCDSVADETLNADLDGDGITVCGGDCDGFDNNCDGGSDEGLTFDLDGDGFSSPSSCEGTRDDCSDGDGSINPDAAEICDFLDNDCDGSVDEGFDGDLDGFTVCGGDCNDGDASINPSASEVCDNVDDNCNGIIDDGFDADGDGVTVCAASGVDCDDADATTFPAAPEICDGLDNNCDGAVDEGVDDDLDGDGVSVCAGDCDDADPDNYPANSEVCDLSDNNCDGAVDEGFDADGDGFSQCASPVSDCDDSSADIYPGRLEVFHNGRNDDCDAGTAEDYSDTFIIVPADDGRLYYARSVGDGSWADYKQIAKLSGIIRGAAIADYDNDGDLDFVAGSPSGHTLSIYLFLNDGADNFTNMGVVGIGNNTNSYQMDMTAGDFDHDGNMDFRSNSNWLYLHEGKGDGHGNFTVTTINTGIGNGRGLDAADFDHDGHLDFVRTDSSARIYLYKGVGDGTFTNLGQVADSGTDAYGLTAADFNNDGHVDFIGNSSSSGNATFFAGIGDGTFAAGVPVPSIDFNNHGAYDNYDFNRDGNQDLVATTYTSRKIHYYPGNGDGTFGAVVVINATNTDSNILGISAPPGPAPAGDPVPWIIPHPYTGAKGDTVNLSGVFSTDDGSIVDYSWDFGDGDTGAGSIVPHPYPDVEDDYHVTLRVTDDEGKVGFSNGLVLLVGDPPVANAGGPYTFGEDFAVAGIYTVPLDGSNSSDDGVDPLIFDWNLGDELNEDFSGGAIDSGLWDSAGATVSAEQAVVAGIGSWGSRYLVTKRTFPRNSTGITTFTGVVGTSINNTVMWGLKNTNTDFSYTQFPYAIYFNSNSWIYIYEDGGNRGNLVQYTEGDDYEVRIDVKTGNGASYYFRPVGSSTWTLIYDSSHSSTNPLKFGATVSSGAIRLDDFVAPAQRSNEEMPTVDYFGDGLFNISLTVTDIADQSDTDNTTVATVVGDRPVAHPGGPYTPGEDGASCGNYTVAFDGSGSTDDSGRIYRYDWDFGDGVLGTGVSPSHTYAAGGPVPTNYTVTLTVTDHVLQQNTLITTATVTPTPGAFPVAVSADYSVDESAASAGLWTVNFVGSTSSDDNGLCDFVWDFGDGGTGTGAAPSHQYSAVGDYTGTLTVRDHALQSHQVNFNVHVEANDPPVPDDGGPYAVNEDAAQNGRWTVGFDAGGSSDDNGIWKYEWDFGDGSTGTGATPTHVYAADGTYDVTLTVFDNAGQTTVSTTQVTVNSNNPPVADAGPSHITERGLPVTLDATGSTDDFGILSYSWDFDQPSFLEDFSAITLDTGRWAASGAVISSDEAVVTGAGGWGSRYLVTQDAFTRNAGDSYTGRMQADSGGNRHVMWGLKNTGSNYSYTQFYYAIYFTNNSVAIYESGTPRGTFGSFVDNTSYDVRIDVKASGATYYYRVTGAPAWIQLYDSTFSSAGSFRLGATVHSGVIRLDDFAAPSLAGSGSNQSAVAVTYSSTGTFQPTVTVTDHALQTDSDSTTVTVVEGDSPVADAGGPYLTEEDIPTRFNGRGSSDDFGIKTYSWDFGDGSTLTSRNPFADHRYVLAGSYVVTLTVTDYAGHTNSDSDTINVSAEPVVAAVPWRFSGGIEVPHDTWSGYQATLKAVAWSLQTPLTYEWDFGDGSAPVTGTVANKRIIQAKHTYTGVDGKPFTARIKITDANGVSVSDQYLLRIRDRSQDIENNVAIDNGLWYLHGRQSRSESGGLLYGEWTNNGYFAHATASAVQALEINGHLELGDVYEDPYVETVSRGLHSMFTRLTTTVMTNQTYGNPDTNGNGIGVGVNSSRPIYEGGMVMDAIAGSASASTYADSGPAGVKDRSYRDIAQDMIDQYAWGQYDNATVGGGWRYSWNQHPDSSAAQWAAIGALALKQVFGLDYPQWVKDRNDVWLNYSFNGNGFGYTGAGDGVATTPSGMVQLIMNGMDRDDPRWMAAENRTADQWDSRYNNSRTSRFSNYYSLFALTKSMRLALPTGITNLRGSGRNNGLDWFNDPAKGVAATLTEDALASTDGSFAGGASWVSQPTRTAWGVIMLTPTLFVQPPVADAGSNRVWGVDVPITLDASGSFHQDPFRSIVLYEWDVDGDGIYDSASTSPTFTHTYALSDYPEASLPQTVAVRLRVTDDNDPAQRDTDTVSIIIAVPPHPPIADIGGPYICTAGLPCRLDGSGSFDIDPTDFITTWEWDLDNDGAYDDASGIQPEVIFPDNGSLSIGLRVVDNAVLNDENGNGVQDPEERLDDFDFASVTVHVNNPPVADPGGPYTIDEGSSILLDGSGSTDPDGNPITYAWDLDNDGLFDDATGPTANFDASALDNGTYTVGLEVSDSLLSDSITTLVVVNNVAPAVDSGADAVIDEAGTLSQSGSFSDPGPDTWSATVNYGDGSGDQPLTLNPDKSFSLNHTYSDNGSYTVTVTVTDDDGGVGSDALLVTVNNVAPMVEAGPDQTVNEGDTVNFSGSFTDPGVEDTHTIEWDFGDGSPPVTGTLTPSHTYSSGGIYTITVTVTDDDGGAGADSLVVTVEGGTQLEPPISDLYARAKDSKIDLVWAPMPGASGYNVYRGTTQGGSYSLIAPNHQCSYCAYADFGLTNGTTYYYVVSWTNGAGESENSNEASATPAARTRTR